MMQIGDGTDHVPERRAGRQRRLGLLWKALTDTATVLSLHLGSSGKLAFIAPDAPDGRSARATPSRTEPSRRWADAPPHDETRGRRLTGLRSSTAAGFSGFGATVRLRTDEYESLTPWFGVPIEMITFGTSQATCSSNPGVGRTCPRAFVR